MYLISVIPSNCVLWSHHKCWPKKYWTIASRRNSRLGSCELLVITFSSFTNSHSLLKFMSTESVMLSNHLILGLRLLLLPRIFPSFGVFSSESALSIRWTKYWSYSFSISLSNEYSGLVSFRIDWFDLLVVQWTLKSLIQHQDLKASILWCSAFFMVQLLHPFMTTGKTIALTRQTFVSKVMSLLFNTLSRVVIAFLPRHIF